METRSPLGVEEWAFVQSALETGAQYNVQLGSDRSYEFAAPNLQLGADTRVMRTIEKKRLKAVSFAKQQSAWDEARTERGNQQLRSKQLKESERLRKVCLHQAAALIDACQNVCQEGEKSSLLVVEQEKEGETMEQWLMSELRAIGKRSREATEEDKLPIQWQKKLKKTSLETQADERPFEGEMMKLQTPG
ncbi:hypothetical protein PHYPSEUDO_011693 [Phytophthora pseudosyringae]|uniref:Uncharacterized protein n=1 Tax=Phytophthora pseudosyringae TaxID=221518 RepID=A0A8T1WAZ4_9STRA|nr:hypothetical protein PHYPSEUDO_011693 [Phytophthora pseudosyringae]